MQQHLLTYHCREYKMDILNITGTAVKASFSGEAIICIFVFKTKHNYKVLVGYIKMCDSNIFDQFP